MMMHADIPANFFDYGATGLDNDACALIMARLDDDICARFLGSGVIDYEFSETTAAREVRTCRTLEKILTEKIPEPKERCPQICHYKAMVTLHDISDILKEVIVASTETNPLLKAQCAQALKTYDQVLTPFVYHLALFAKAEKNDAVFNDTIYELRAATVTEEQKTRGFTLSEANDFCLAAVQNVQAQTEKFTSYLNWRKAGAVAQTALMMHYFNEIETASSFAGIQAQTHEKCDGTDYACRVQNTKNCNGLNPTNYSFPGIVLDRFHGRYEKHLSMLFDHATNRGLAGGTLRYCYQVSKSSFTFAKGYLCLDDSVAEPGLDDNDRKHYDFVREQHALFEQGKQAPSMRTRDYLVGLYDEAIYDLDNRHIAWLPECGKTLAASKTIRKVSL